MNEFDFPTLLRYLGEKKKYFLFSAVIGLALGLGVAFSIPKTYTSKMSLAIESQREQKLSGGMGALASMAGVDIVSGEDAISPNLYPDVVSTNKFLVDLLHTPVQTIKGKNYKTYVEFTKSRSAHRGGRRLWEAQWPPSNPYLVISRAKPLSPAPALTPIDSAHLKSKS